MVEAGRDDGYDSSPSRRRRHARLPMPAGCGQREAEAGIIDLLEAGAR